MNGMTVKDAVARRIMELCAEHNLSVNGLARQAGMEPTTVYSMLNEKSRNPGVVTIQKICDGLGISVREFFDSPLFDGLEAVIR